MRPLKDPARVLQMYGNDMSAVFCILKMRQESLQLAEFVGRLRVGKIFTVHSDSSQ